MYCLNDKQIDYILNDIRARGVEMEDLQYNLLDHICCIMEQNLGETGDFENFYQQTIKKFYKKELWELEEETISLIIFKNYYTMKKIMLYSGIISAFLVAVGILFKFMHWPGASISLVLGISISSLIFLPMMFILKVKEKQSRRDKLISGLGAIAGSALSMGILFKIMHWPGANMLGMGAVLLMVFVFLPIYFFTGIRQAETRVNTIVSSAIIIIGAGLFMALIRAPRGSMMIKVRNTANYVQSQNVVNSLRSIHEKQSKDSSFHQLANSKELDVLCEELKADLLFLETGVKSIDENFEAKGLYLDEGTYGYNPFLHIPSGQERFAKLSLLAENYNAEIAVKKDILKPLPVSGNFIAYVTANEFRILNPILILEQLSQMQMILLENNLLAAN